MYRGYIPVGLIGDTVCQKCNAASEDEFHRKRQCFVNLEINEECVKETQGLVKLAIEGPTARSLLDARTDPEKAGCRFKRRRAPHEWWCEEWRLRGRTARSSKWTDLE